MRLPRGLRAALSYFTVLPVGAQPLPGPAALAWLPLVGVALGCGAGLAGRLAAGSRRRDDAASRRGSDAAKRPALGAAVAFAALLAGTGALHVDGFLDGCDAFFAPVEASRRREILDDPHHGTFAIAGFAAIAALQLGALASLDPRRYPLALATAAGLARAFVAQAFFRRPEHRAAVDVRARLTLAAGSACVLALATSRRTGEPSSGAGVDARPRSAYAAAAPAAVAGIAATLCERGIGRALGGAPSGDGYGFTIVVCETAALVALTLGDR